MVIAVRTESGPEGLTVVKTAETDAERLRLAGEAELLRQAAHPGVVEIVDVTPDELRLRHAGTTLTHMMPLAADHAAAVVCVVAEILDGVHGAGVAHGQLDTDHVVLDERGRPRLCGFGRATPIDDRRADAATTDIGDLGALFDILLDEAAHLPWTPTNAGARHRTRRKHAREIFRNVAGMAQRSDPRQRIAPHQMANAIREALPALKLPTPPRQALDADGTPIAGMSGIPDDAAATDDVGWTSLELEYLADSSDTPAQPPSHEAPPEATEADVDEMPAPAYELEPDPEPTPPEYDLEPTPAPEYDLEPTPAPEYDLEPTPAPEYDLEPDPEPTPAPEYDLEPEPPSGPELTPDNGSDTTSTWVAPSERPTPTPADEPMVRDDHRDIGPDDGAVDDQGGDETDDRSGTDLDQEPEHDPVAAVARLQRALAEGGPPQAPPRELPPITIREPSGTAKRRRRRPVDAAPPVRRTAMAAGLLFVAGLILGPLAYMLVQALDDDDDPATSNAAATSSSTTLPEVTGTWPSRCELPDLTGPDIDSDGCPEPVTVNGRNVQVGATPIAFGDDGDLVAVADTDCDGVVTPYLLRPSSGQVFAWAEWPLESAVDVRATDEISGATDIERREGATCDVVVVLAGSGETVVAGTP